MDFKTNEILQKFTTHKTGLAKDTATLKQNANRIMDLFEKVSDNLDVDLNKLKAVQREADKIKEEAVFKYTSLLRNQTEMKSQLKEVQSAYKKIEKILKELGLKPDTSKEYKDLKFVENNLIESIDISSILQKNIKKEFPKTF